MTSNQFGGGGGGAAGTSGVTSAGLAGGGGGDSGTGAAGTGGFGGGGGGTTIAGIAGTGGFAGGDGSASATGGGGGGAGLGGALFLQDQGHIVINGAFAINGSSATGGAGGAGAVNGSAFGSDIFLQGFNYATFAPGATDGDATGAISDELGSLWGRRLEPALHAGSARWCCRAQQLRRRAVHHKRRGQRHVRRQSGIGWRCRQYQQRRHARNQRTGLARRVDMNGGIDTVSVAPGHTATWSGQLSESETASALG